MRSRSARSSRTSRTPSSSVYSESRVDCSPCSSALTRLRSRACSSGSRPATRTSRSTSRMGASPTIRSFCRPSRVRTAMRRPVRILLVEDNKVFREALELLLGMRADVEVVQAVADGSDAVAACEQHRPEVVLMDYRLPGMDGVQATAAVKQAFPEIAVVCLTASANSREIQALYDAGATECLTKDQELDVIVDALVRAAA